MNPLQYILKIYKCVLKITYWEHRQKALVTLSGFLELREVGGLGESVKKGKIVMKVILKILKS